MIQNLDKNEQIGFKYNDNGFTKTPNTIIIYVGKKAALLKKEFYSRTIRPREEKDLFLGTAVNALQKFGEDYFKKRIVIVRM